MADVRSRVAFVASIALHAGAIAWTFYPASPAGASVGIGARSDFWAGTTFEVPDSPGDGPEGAEAAGSRGSPKEINVDGVEAAHETRTYPDPAGPSANNRRQPSPAHPSPSRRPRAMAAAPGASAGGAPGSAQPGGTPGTFGAEAAAAGVRDLVRSFVRAIPIVASSDPVWSTLPLGAAGSTEITLTLDEEGKPHTAQPLDPGTPAHLRRLVAKTLTVMAGGRFGVPGTEVAGAEQKVRIALALTQESPPSGDQLAFGGAFALRFEPPDEHRVSHAFLTLASGRRVEVTVRVLDAKR